MVTVNFESMQRNVKRIIYQTSNSYETLNQLTNDTHNIWVVFHGLGYLSRYFLKYFKALNTDENYIIAPQAPAKYYLKDDFKYVGASWLTKEDTKEEIANTMRYLDAVYSSEQLPADKRLVLFGFSQGVSVLLRWMAHRKLPCDDLVLYAGGIPNELTPEDFSFLDGSKTRVNCIYGDSDQYLTPEKLAVQISKAQLLFKDKLTVTQFEGGHEIQPEIVQKIVTT